MQCLKDVQLANLTFVIFVKVIEELKASKVASGQLQMSAVELIEEILVVAD